MIDQTKNVPLHVSLIMDGNGRWAKERGKERVYGHFEGVASVRACVEAAVENGVRYLSLFAFSSIALSFFFFICSIKNPFSEFNKFFTFSNTI